MAYKHGVYVTEEATSITSAIEGTAGLQVIVGTAPVNMLDDPSSAVNTPILAYTYKEAVAAVGYSDDFESYTLCEAIAANFQVIGVAPIVLINVLDPSKHTTDVETTSVTVSSYVATIEETGILLDNLTVSYDGTALTADTDYTASFDDDGYVSIVLLEDGSAYDATELTVSGTKLDPSAIEASDIVGGVDSTTGDETGLEVIRQVYPKLSMTPGILLAPRWSADATVAAALQAKCTDINGVFKAVCYIDVDSSSDGATAYTAVNEQKTTQAITSEYAYAIWGYGKVGDVVYSGSALAAALTAYTDASNDDVPNVSPSNQTISISGACLADGTDMYIDLEQANVVNSYGVATWLNMNGYRLWGNNTAIYPNSTDPKDRWLSVRRFLNWTANTFILSYFQYVDSPLNQRLIDAIVDSENIRGNSFVSRGICARYEIEYDEDENTTESLLDGTIIFHQYVTPYVPAEDIEDVIEFDPDALEAALG